MANPRFKGLFAPAKTLIHLTPFRAMFGPWPATGPVPSADRQAVLSRPPAIPRQATPALFKAFADAQPTTQGMAAFTAKFGDPLAEGVTWLVDPRADRIIDVIVIQADGRDRPNALQTADWAEEIMAMGRCLRLWELVQEGNTERLKHHIRWHTGPGPSLITYDSHPAPGCPEALMDPPREVLTLASEESNPVLMQRLNPADPAEPALCYIDEVISDHLRDRVVPRMLPVFPARRAMASVAGRRQGTALHLVPRNLLGGIWLQFGDAVIDNKHFQKCQVCGDWYAAWAGKERNARGAQQYCSDRCKVQAYRGRKEEAIRLHGAGKTVAAIAKQLGSTPETVKGWIASSKSEGE